MTFALTIDGKVYAAGGNQLGQLGFPDNQNRNKFTLLQALENEKIIKISTGGNHCLALSENGNLYAWGWGAEGRLGFEETKDISVPKKHNILSKRKISKISTGGSHSMILCEDNEIFVFGWNGHGQLGLDTTTSALAPTLLKFFTSGKYGKVVDIICGFATTFFITEV
eukprot:TRINITY_DN3885_c2_g1_i3.p1 TRINITY_DN3885_c2_g1~~TRINITY_DN3885_c2_g1_i3.p1  ORF type:complete len:168 (+),score=81.01 TRINITY_DN3885_c2_g1_i3:290-793(+)